MARPTPHGRTRETLHRKPKWTNGQIVAAMRDAFAVHGPLSAKGWNRLKLTPHATTIKAHFGGWQEACRKAGLEPLQHVRWTREAIVQQMRTVAAREGRKLTMAEWLQKGYEPSPYAVFSIAPWSELWAEAGHPTEARWAHGRTRRWSDEEILAALRRAAVEHGSGGPVTIPAWGKLKLQPCVATIRNRFGDWQTAWDKAGIAQMVEATREEVLESIRACARDLASTPSQRVWLAWPKHVYVRPFTLARYGGWRSLLQDAVQRQMPTIRSVVRDHAKIVWERYRDNLSERDRAVIQGVVKGKTLVMVAREHGVTREAIRQIIKRAYERQDHPKRHKGQLAILHSTAGVSGIPQPPQAAAG